MLLTYSRNSSCSQKRRESLTYGSELNLKVHLRGTVARARTHLTKIRVCVCVPFILLTVRVFFRGGLVIFLHFTYHFAHFSRPLHQPFGHHCTAIRSTAQQNILSCFLLKLNAMPSHVAGLFVCMCVMLLYSYSPFQWHFLIEALNVCFGAHSSSMFGHYYLFLAFSFGLRNVSRRYHIHKYIQVCFATLLPLFPFLFFLSLHTHIPPDINLVWD